MNKQATAEIKCRICKKINKRQTIEEILDVKNWEMQHLHFADGELEFMTCPECKLLHPTKYLEIVCEGL